MGEGGREREAEARAEQEDQGGTTIDGQGAGPIEEQSGEEGTAECGKNGDEAEEEEEEKA